MKSVQNEKAEFYDEVKIFESMHFFVFVTMTKQSNFKVIDLENKHLVELSQIFLSGSELSNLLKFCNSENYSTHGHVTSCFK